MELLLNNPWVVLIGGGFIIGFLIGITGVGAGSLTTPLLITGVGVPPAMAVGTDLMFAAITKASAGWRHHSLGNVNWPVLRWLAGGSIPGALIVIAWLYFAEPDTDTLSSYIRQILAVTLIVSAIAILYDAIIEGRRQETSDFVEVRRWPTLFFGLILGILVALTSVGAGAIGVAVLAGLYSLMPARRIVGTDIAHAVPLTLVAGAGHAGMGNVDIILLGSLLIGSVPGILLGSRVVGIIPEWALRILLAIVLTYAAYLLYQHGFGH